MVYINRAAHNKPGHAGTIAALLALVLVGCAAPSAAATRDHGMSHVRSTDSTVLAMIREGSERSASFRSVLEAIGRTNGIVYVEFGYCAFGHLNGCLLPFIATVHDSRYLRVVVMPPRGSQSHEQLLSLIAHELRHALEVCEHPEVVDVTTMEALYRRIGTPETGGLTGYETSAARAAGDRVRSELRQEGLASHAPGAVVNSEHIRPR